MVVLNGGAAQMPKNRPETQLWQIWVNNIILVGCAQTAAVLDESMLGRMGDCWDFIIGWLID